MSNTSQRSGIPCPRCQFFIPMTMEMLLSGAPVICPRCELRLEVDAEKSRGALDAVRKVHDAIAHAEATRNQFA